MFKILTSPIKYGDEGKRVEEAQKLLQKAGSKIQINGKFTIGMRTAVESFQRKNKLKVTGIIDARTWEKLNAKSEKKTGRKKA